MFITIKYSCPECSLSKREVIVPARNPGQDFEHYLEDVISDCLSADHKAKSPHCPALGIKDLMIPLGEQGLGFND